ncbi:MULTISPECIES: hypothetical protein [Vibrio]|uniref:hypothetical protein n=1 Tax=Vibrio TaxID=662 RepID=UPI00063200F3|nr:MULTISPECIES: hypothetical protein [Vibrio]MCG9674752.1 hypothetical protein [Vibrio chagasii]TCO00691.1 hypothetical protein EDB30_11070 [Vibrio crassostreae]CAK1816816.1 hypothetical protein VCRA2119O381_160016 [Vibrio crassostreae]CAK2240089.1 hypothetical protein VCRA2117O379_90127 [Vibrio crassostreae]CAK2241628.1 hypothetical protein VCRA2119O382_90126 [Vibrio crassostreae]
MKYTKFEPTATTQAVYKARAALCRELSQEELSLLPKFAGHAAIRTFGGSAPRAKKAKQLFADLFDVKDFKTFKHLASDQYQMTNSERFLLSLKKAQRFRNLSLVSKRGEKLTFSYRIGRINLKFNELDIPLWVTLLLSISPKNATVEYIVHSAQRDDSMGDHYYKKEVGTDFTNRISNEFIRQSLLAFNSGMQQWKADYLDSVLSEVFISTLASIEREIKSCNKCLTSSLFCERQKEELRLKIQNLESTVKPLVLDLRSSGLKIEYEKIEVNSEYKNCAYGEQGKYLFEPVRCLEELLKAGIHLTNELIGFAHSKHHYKKLELVNLDRVQRDLPKWRKNPRNDEQFVRLCARKYGTVVESALFNPLSMD